MLRARLGGSFLIVIEGEQKRRGTKEEKVRKKEGRGQCKPMGSGLG